MDSVTMKSKLFSGLLFPVWISFFLAVSFAYVSFKFDALAQGKEANFKSAEKQLSAVVCKDIHTDVVLSIARLAYETPRNDAKIFEALAELLFFTSLLNLIFVWKYLKTKPS